ncbi:MAG: hypothetical protein PHE88_07935 [Elusimicrobia bacterium]|nr:hypothetical protein [Elusimicrobiota bacterium]
MKTSHFIKVIHRLILISAVMIVTSPNCTSIQITDKEIGDKNSLNKVLIVSEKDGFKDPVISKIIDMLKKDGDYLLISKLKNINDNITKKYGAVVIVNSVKQGQKGRSVKVFLSEQEQKKIILFNAVGPEYWKSNVNKTEVDNSGKIANTIVAKVRLLLSR